MSLVIKRVPEGKRKDGALGRAGVWCDSWKQFYRRRKAAVQRDSFRRDTMYGGMREKTKWEKGREWDFTCIPEATVRRFTLRWYVLSLTSRGCHGNPASSVGWALGVSAAAGLSCFYLGCCSSYVLTGTSPEKWKEKGHWLFVCLHHAPCETLCFYRLVFTPVLWSGQTIQTNIMSLCTHGFLWHIFVLCACDRVNWNWEHLFC